MTYTHTSISGAETNAKASALQTLFTLFGSGYSGAQTTALTGWILV